MEHNITINNKPTVDWGLTICLIFFSTILSSCFKPPALTPTILITTQPQDARIFIDGKFKGNSPFLYKHPNKFKKAPNTSLIRIEKKNYYSYQKTLSFAPSSKSNTTYPHDYSFELVPIKRPFQIKFSAPPQKVYLNRQLVEINRRGYLNLEIPNGHYDLLAIRKNTPFLEHQFALSDKSPKSIKLIFPKPRVPNRLTIKSPLDRENHKRDGVAIYYKQIKIGTTPFTLNYLPITPFQLVFTKPGRLQKTVTFSLHKNEKRIVVIRLAKENQPSFDLNFKNLPSGSRVMLNQKIVVLKNNHLKVPILSDTSSNPSNTLFYSYRTDHPAYYPIQGSFSLKATNHTNLQQTINLQPVKKIAAPKLIKEINHGVDLLSAKVFPVSSANPSELFISDKKNRLFIYDADLNLKDQYDFSNIKTNNIPSLSHGFLRKGKFLLTRGIVSSSTYFSYPTKFNQPRYFLTGTNSTLVLFNNGSHEINLWVKNRPEKVLTRRYYSTENFIQPLDFGQAIWWNHQFLVTDRLNRNIKSYNLITEKASYFKILPNEKPRQIYAIEKYHHLLAVAGIHKIYLYLPKPNLEGELLQIWDLPKIKNDKIEFLFFLHKKFILVTTHKILLFGL